VYFPISGVVSVLYITEDGEPTEIAVIGNEGLVGLAVVLGGGSTPRRAVVQIDGHAYRMKAETILERFRRGGALQVFLLRYVQTLMNQMAQTAVCNRHHAIEQQLCRWLLLSLDRTSSNEVFMTQDLISQMLGVRRSGISEAAKKLQDLRLIDYRRGHIVVLNRKKLEARACECYAIVKRESDRLMIA
jgi:CRP-like cAMP-binding protein